MAIDICPGRRAPPHLRRPYRLQRRAPAGKMKHVGKKDTDLHALRDEFTDNKSLGRAALPRQKNIPDRQTQTNKKNRHAIVRR